MDGYQDPKAASPKCKTYFLNCSTCHERFASTKCTNPTEKHTHAKPQELTSLQGGQLRAKLQGFTTNCWHCDPEAQLDFTTGRTEWKNSLASRRGSVRRRVDLKVHQAGSLRSRVSQRHIQSRTMIRAVARRSSTITASRISRVGKALRRWTNGLLELSACFTSRQRSRGEKIPEEEEPPRPASAHTLDAWKLPRMFPPIDD